MVHISDACNHLERNHIQSLFYTCINTDILSIPKHFIGLLQNYASTIATITPLAGTKPVVKTKQANQDLSSQKERNQTLQKLFSINDKSDTHVSIVNQISSLWQVRIERNYSKDFLLRTNPLDLQRIYMSSQHEQQHQQQSIQMNYHCNAIYAIIWTYDQMNDYEDSSYDHERLGFDDNDDEEIDYDAREIVWRLV